MPEYALENIEREIKRILLNEFSRAALLFRLHSRIKEKSSIEEKIMRKGDYNNSNKLMQDLIGFRITTYFNDDIAIAVEICEKLFEKIELIYDEPDAEVFKPLRKNMVCRLPSESLAHFTELKLSNEDFSYIDSTFEIQFRTTLSEGWHEVDHNLRYKCKNDWTKLSQESRMLNGIYASLETNDQALKALFEDIAYHHYTAQNWEAMIRNKFRLKFSNKELSSELVAILNGKKDIGKAIFKLNRNKIIKSYVNSTISFPMSFNSLMYYINYFYIKNDEILKLTPVVLLDDFKCCEK